MADVAVNVTKRDNRTPGEKIFDFFNYILLIILAVSMIYPFLSVLMVSLTSDNVARDGMFYDIIPQEISFNAYRKVFRSEYILSGYIVTIERTVLGTFLTLLVTTITAYALSKKHFPNRTFWTMVIVFTMIFNGGLIPTYLLVKQLGLINNILALILPRLVNTFNMIIMRNYFMTLPESLEESARMEGAGDMKILFAIILPLSLPIIATITLWTAVGHWNAWFDSLIYTRDVKKLVLQVVLRRIILEGTSQMIDNSSSIGTETINNPDTVKAASILVTTLPIMIVYPFIQKYFIKGVLVGSIKG